jgi:hypothetical protein
MLSSGGDARVTSFESCPLEEAVFVAEVERPKIEDILLALMTGLCDQEGREEP